MKIEKIGNGVVVERKTLETHIRLLISNDKLGRFEGKTPSGFLDHMFKTFCKYSKISVVLEKCEGDTYVDLHHTVEDLGIVLGAGFKENFDYSRLSRFGNFTVPMDDALVSVYVDLSGRSYLNFDVNFSGAQLIGNLPVELIEEFFRSFVNNAKITMHVIKLAGSNSHHVCEALFKAFALSVKMATESSNDVTSTKGVID